MAAEVYIIFEDKKWYYMNKERIEEKIYSLRTFFIPTMVSFGYKMLNTRILGLLM